MADKTHAPGTFCWNELMTTDSAAAKKFYGELFGWTFHDDDIPGGGTYTMVMLDGGPLAGAYELSDEMKAEGVPPHWAHYVSVEDAAATCARAKELGAKLVKDAFDVMDIGRMAVIQDPTGAVFHIWQPLEHTGSQHERGTVGAVSWNELATSDADRAGGFYSKLFGWSPQVQDMGEVQYTIFKQGDDMVGGMFPMSGEMFEGVPPHWMVYFHVEDTDQSVSKAVSLGAEVKVPATDIPNMGRFATMQDPQGVVFSVFAAAKS